MIADCFQSNDQQKSTQTSGLVLLLQFQPQVKALENRKTDNFRKVSRGIMLFVLRGPGQERDWMERGKRLLQNVVWDYERTGANSYDLGKEPSRCQMLTTQSFR